MHCQGRTELVRGLALLVGHLLSCRAVCSCDCVSIVGSEPLYSLASDRKNSFTHFVDASEILHYFERAVTKVDPYSLEVFLERLCCKHSRCSRRVRSIGLHKYPPQYLLGCTAILTIISMEFVVFAFCAPGQRTAVGSPFQGRQTSILKATEEF